MLTMTQLRDARTYVTDTGRLFIAWGNEYSILIDPSDQLFAAGADGEAADTPREAISWLGANMQKAEK